MLIEPELSDVAVVLRGHLNPRIFTPDWFARNDLFTVKEAESSEIEVVHSQRTVFRTEPFTVRVEPERFQAHINEAPYVRVADLVIRTFKEFLSHTPLTRLGINRTVHFDVGSFETRDKIGLMLAPHAPWGEWAQFLSGAGKEHGGMVSLTMQQRELEDRAKGWISAKVQPSTRVGGGRTGIYMEINDHYEVKEPEKVAGCDEVIGILEKHFDASLKRSDWIIDQIMRLK